MGRELLRAGVLYWVLLPALAVAQDSYTTWELPPTPPEGVQYFSSDTWEDVSESMSGSAEFDSTSGSWALDWAFDLLGLLLEPVCKLTMGFLDAVHMPDTVVLDMQAGYMGSLFGIVDAWIPAKEMMAHVLILTTLTLIWTPIRFVLKLIPGTY